jgi:hypothetical protein
MRAEEIAHREAFNADVDARMRFLEVKRSSEAVEPYDTLSFLEAEAVLSTVNIPWDPEAKHIITARIMTSGEIDRYLNKLRELEAISRDTSPEKSLEIFENLKELKMMAADGIMDEEIAEFIRGPISTYNQVVRLMNERMSRSFVAGGPARSFRPE